MVVDFGELLLRGGVHPFDEPAVVLLGAFLFAGAVAVSF